MENTPIRVGMISLGCPKNQVDAEVMLAKLTGEGFTLTPHADAADVVIVNTCGFIEDAKKESIENILEMAQLKKEGAIRGLVVTGCLSERYFKEMRQEFPEVNCILQVGRAGDIAEAVRAAADGGTLDFSGRPESLAAGGTRVLTTLPFYSYLKIAEGCDNHCTYCIIPKLRGRYRSRPLDDLVREAEQLAARGVRELTLVAQDTTRYGTDLSGGKRMLPELLRRFCRIDGLHWVRLLYCYPEALDDELIDTIASEEKVVPYLDMPIQHVSPRVVRAMNRRMSKAEITALVCKLRARIPDVTLRTTLIVGFPGETEEEFAELAAFVRETRFERLGAFAYSQEEGTPAAELPGQIDEDVKKRRQEQIMEEQMLVADANNQRRLGSTVEVLVEGYDRYAGCWFGRSAAEAPEIDGKIFIRSQKTNRPGTFVSVHLDEVCGDDLIGSLEEGEMQA
ncbi:30S ribosomal protein S12 methylthiotransferase RimO [Ethanoligenens harbinense]|uniref:Ribosomal protein uS12 methylthiotransferase RimO n=1 Tax=Ethanoligenens harbinense (strain DSM 18485 / JCM 12961 / CGMCC 1.5033 / YUAN-3) TaxID=663278 RepID=E6U2V4_ETHHY|nr:30S ribosomal protein S12 methylthiotransferase RimO [Ethanoligenens harbinense]ADU27496.1 MiaB-like tRNA modifying enzyme YliG [Ethanoligenens harbinense YUAN-3]AVQ96552.1 30S ribosomal protein S12 methylthiotransferase RimO [Ethanoligenens harbinense YUAN-3]AYF39213.1 30S ribosomal protein S12 methylthiotransferase RimO [Ethanoligenens harbinense]AYF42037.1 30S ribosomal protein S12 methylthiotransferase RimO [Ethanoligenens harbinense]QCN92792.1 30S ribosomal protein S12 methylthiotransf